MIFLGLAGNYSARDIFRHSFTLGSRKDYDALEAELVKRYGGKVETSSLTFSGRTAIAVALDSMVVARLLKKGDHVAINGFTCYAVVEAIKHVGLKPVYLDLEKIMENAILPNFSANALDAAASADPKLKAVIIQNTFGFPADIRAIEKVSKAHHLLMIEDLAHCAGRKYPDGREMGTVGDATCLSFGKGKAIDTILGGAVILRNPELSLLNSFDKSQLSRKQHTDGDAPRVSWYPLFGAIARGLTHLHLERFWLGLLLKLKWIERSGDTKIRYDKTITDWQAKLALRQVKLLKNSALREFYLVDNREECLKELKRHGAHLEEFWYETPIAPKRFYKKAKYKEADCPNAVFFAKHVVNLPTWYKTGRRKKQLAKAKTIVKSHELKGSAK